MHFQNVYKITTVLTMRKTSALIGFWLHNVMMLWSAINITHIPEEQVAYKQCTMPSLPLAKAWLREASSNPCN